MTLSLLGTFPASSLNIGLAAVPVGLNSAVAKLAADTTRLTGSLDTQLAVSASFPPNVAGYVAAFGLLNPATLAALLNPTTWASLNTEANLAIVAELGFVNGELAIVSEIAAAMRAGLDSGGLAGWSYAGRAAGFGTQLQNATRFGFGGIRADQNVDAVIVATNAFSSWGSFSAGIDTGDSASLDLGSTTAEERLRFLGTRTGRQVNVGLAGAFDPIDLYEAQLNGMKLALEAQLEVSVGLNLPDPGDLVIDVDVEAAIGNMTVQADIDADIGALELQAKLLLDLVGDIEAQLSAGGLVLWSYSGPASALGSSFEAAIRNGLPGTTDGPSGTVYGTVIACASPAAWSSFGGIFKVAA